MQPYFCHYFWHISFFVCEVTASINATISTYLQDKLAGLYFVFKKIEIIQQKSLQ